MDWISYPFNDPAFYDRMSTLLDEIIADLRAKRVDYEELTNALGYH